MTKRMPSPILIACHECDVLHRETTLPPHSVARCIRCGAVLYRRPHDCLNRSLAFAIGAALLFVLANIYPIMILDARGVVTTANLFDTVLELYHQNKPLVASLVLVTTILVPATQILGMVYLLLPLKLGQIPHGFGMVFR